ncbi:MAG: hypothetical protein K2Q12_11345 [Rickettsiales bacterium]|nr:hypothetical protein [Rickettsiales bacterium]
MFQFECTCHSSESWNPEVISRQTALGLDSRLRGNDIGKELFSQKHTELVPNIVTDALPDKAND